MKFKSFFCIPFFLKKSSLNFCFFFFTDLGIDLSELFGFEIFSY